ncbi:hypothetical protein M5689_024754 [Euphorbia peplus]|nr:hypothetical protein M5689_024754 [Euphorbia peplus]
MDDDELNLLLLQLMHNFAAIQAVCAVIYCYAKHKHDKRQITHKLRVEGEQARDELMTHLSSSRLCHNVIRMSASAFLGLCDLLVRYGGLRPTIIVSVQEQVAKALWLLGHNVSHREISFFFRRSGETTSRHFHNVLDAIIALHAMFLKQPDGSQIPSEILTKDRFYPYFKDCVGAIDGTHIRVKVLYVDAPKYRGRKEYPIQNVLAACTFDLKFTYVLTGWEETASNSRIIKNALSRQNPLKISEGKYYLVDVGFMLRSGLITPYRGERYHLKEYSRNPPQNARELFNLRHASLRNTIERAFGVLKNRFPIIGSSTEPHYNVKTQNEIICACCILHNYLIGTDPSAEILAEVDNELENRNNLHQEHHASGENNEETRKGEMIRDSIAAEIWANYI